MNTSCMGSSLHISVSLSASFSIRFLGVGYVTLECPLYKPNCYSSYGCGDEGSDGTVNPPVLAPFSMMYRYRAIKETTTPPTKMTIRPTRIVEALNPLSRLICSSAKSITADIAMAVNKKQANCKRCHCNCSHRIRKSKHNCRNYTPCKSCYKDQKVHGH